MLDYCVYLLYRAGLTVIRVLPIRLLFAVGQFLGLCAWAVLIPHRRLALHNLRIAFGKEKDPAELRRLARRHFQTLGANLLCGMKLGLMPLEKVRERTEVENVEPAHQALRAGTPVVLVMSHLSNWELIAQALPHWLGYVRNGTVYQRLRNPFIDAHIQKIRNRANVEMLDRSEGFHRAIEILRGGGVVGVLSDQHAGDHGVWTPFFGRLASTSPLPGLLAKRTKAALVSVAVQTTSPGRWRLVLTPRFDQPGESVAALTARANAVIENQIRLTSEDWFWVHNRWKTPNPNFLLSQYRRGIYVPPQMSKQDLKPFRVLVRAPNWLGDSVMTVPAVRAIKSGRPDVHLTVAAPANLVPIWELIPEVDRVLSLPEGSLLATVRLLRREPSFDVAIIWPNSLRTALETWLSGVPRRVGFRGHHRSWLLNQIVRKRRKPEPPAHQAIKYLRLVSLLGGQTDSVGKAISFPMIQTSVASSLPNQTSNIKHQTSIALCPGAEYGPAKRWLPERFIEVAAAIAEKHPVQWILFGTAKDTAIGEQIVRGLNGRCTNRIGQTSLTQLIDELKTCRLLLTNDTGTMHLASLLGVPVVAVFGSTEPRLTGPMGQRDLVIRHHVECSPCFLRDCPLDFRCMKSVTAEEVTKAVLSMLPNE